MYKYFAMSCFSCVLKCGTDTVLSISSHFVCIVSPVAGHLFDGDRESTDSCSCSGFLVPDSQYLLAGLVLTQPISQVATAGPALPDLLRHVRLHGPGVHR